MNSTFGHGIANEVWLYSQTGLQHILSGMLNLPIVTGVKVEDQAGHLMAAAGTIRDRDGTLLQADEQGRLSPPKPIEEDGTGMIPRKFPITYTDAFMPQRTLGTWTVYSHRRLILEEVQYDLLLIVINSLLSAILLCGVIFFVIQRWLGRPLQRLTQAIRQIRWIPWKPQPSACMCLATMN